MNRATAVIGISLGLFGILVLTLILFRLPVGDSLRIMAEGAFGSTAAWSRTLVKMTPLLLTGLGMVVAWRAGMFNIGGEGQFLMGCIAGATVFHLLPKLPPPILSGLILLSTVAGGALYASLAAWLQLKRGVQVVISTILLNFIALQALDWAVSGPLQESKRQLPMSESVPNAVMMARFSRQSDLHVGVFLALAIAVGLGYWLFRTRAGFQLRVVGQNPFAARSSRIPLARNQLMGMAISGGLCGLAGGIEYLGLAGQISVSSAQNWGFLGIPVALLGGLNPIGTIASAFFFGGLFAGTEHLARFTTAGSTLVYVIQAVAVLGYIAGQRLIRRRTTHVGETS